MPAPETRNVTTSPGFTGTVAWTLCGLTFGIGWKLPAFSGSNFIDFGSMTTNRSIGLSSCGSITASPLYGNR
jgi:hypothetical protein